MSKMILAANWKLHKSPIETRSYLKEFLSLWKPYSEVHEVWFFPPALSLGAFTEITSTAKGLKFGLQNFWKESEGAFTGENSLVVARELGASIGMIGHSERRHIFKEEDSILNEKVKLARDQKMMVLACVGETLEDRNAGNTGKVVREQLKSLFAGVKPFPMAVAYEPVWAIGTGEVATPEQVAEVHVQIRSDLCDLWGDRDGASVPILYGGSVKPGNAAELFSQNEVHGFLVGGASLDPKTFIKILANTL